MTQNLQGDYFKNWFEYPANRWFFIFVPKRYVFRKTAKVLSFEEKNFIFWHSRLYNRSCNVLTIKNYIYLFILHSPMELRIISKIKTRVQRIIIFSNCRKNGLSQNLSSSVANEYEIFCVYILFSDIWVLPLPEYKSWISHDLCSK